MKGRLFEFLEQCMKIESLDLTGCVDFINRGHVQVWEHLGNTLRSLRLHEVEQESGIDHRPILSILEMQNISHCCRKLRSLGTDMESAPNPVST